MQLINEKLPPEVKSEIRKIKYIVITSIRPESLTGASNFSKATIEDRIEAGYNARISTSS